MSANQFHNFTEYGVGTKLYDLFARAASSLQSPFLAIVRVYWGWQIAQNGWGKLHNLGNVTQFFGSLGLPAPGATATFVASFEFVGGILLAVGLLTRIAALGLVIDMTTAYIVADRQAFLSFFSDPNKFAAADPFVFFFVGLLILIFGPGKISIDAFSKHIFRKRALHAASSVPPWRESWEKHR
jgi:putative oxidoreductase